MRLSPLIVVFLAQSVLAAPCLRAEVVTEVVIGGGYQGNLFNDSSSVGDQYAVVGADLKYYPSASIRLSGTAQYNSFATYSDLSSLTGEASITFIPTSDSSALTLALGGNLSMRKLGTTYELYDQVGSTLGANAGYRLTQSAYLLSSISFYSYSYINSDYGSNRSIDLSTGINATIMGSNAVTVRFDYSRRSFGQPTLTPDGPGYVLAAGKDKTEIFEVAGILGRYSRSLGERTGLNLSIGYRQLHAINNLTVLGYTIDYLSPWAELWEGVSFSGSAKHFFHNQVVTELTLAYYDKDYVDVVELRNVTGEAYRRDARSDQLATFSFGISKPISLHSGKTIIPTFFFGYRSNRSTDEFFNYDDVAVSASLRVSI